MQTQTFPRWVEVLFSRLHVRYGDAWLRLWVGIDGGALKADWQEQLQNVFDRNPHAISYALQHLPSDFPPNSAQFLRLCMQKPPEHVALPAPVSKPDPDFAAQVVKRIEAAKPATRLSPGEECAQRLEAIVARGGRLSFPQRAQLEAIRKMTAPTEFPSAGGIDERKEDIAKRVAEYGARVEHV